MAAKEKKDTKKATTGPAAGKEVSETKKSVEKKKAPPAVKEEEKKVEAKKEAPPTPVVDEVKVPFKRWFKAKGFRDRWRGGMEAFTDVTVRRTMAEWDDIFKKY